ncbi:hypothetical protein [Alkalihalobacillus sp. AL-G]|uniref:hypothetical protein n=1 Tax=Alkalihalobacillus sp. AL-G TaxID=2926399 RepID=UPI00272D4C96|nr:hypothetical protein [Alkalihalobacillus sp. AL-G]WLD92969.1 hypothetical protein MOJ78_18505 [Alkalihalobacillus sp. AL-G]
MIHLGTYSFKKLPSLEKNLQTVQQHLTDNKLIIVDAEGIPLPDSTITSRINDEETSTFKVKSTLIIEQETLLEAIEYIDNIEPQIEVLHNSDQDMIINGFVNAMESLVYLDKLVSHFNIDISIDYNLENASQKALKQVEDGNVDYLLDLLEFSFTPLLGEMKTKFQERIVPNGL